MNVGIIHVILSDQLCSAASPLVALELLDLCPCMYMTVSVLTAVFFLSRIMRVAYVCLALDSNE